MKLYKSISLITFAFGSILPVTANEKHKDKFNDLNCNQHLIVADELFCWNGYKFKLANFKNNLEKSEPNNLISTEQFKNVVEKSEPNNLISTEQSKIFALEDIQSNKFETSQNTYQPKDKLDEYIIKGATYSTKFVPLMNDGSDGSDYTNMMS